MRRAVEIRLDNSMRQNLQSLSRSRRASVRFAERAKIVLFAADGMENKKIAAQLKTTRQKIARWRNRFMQFGIEGIEKDAPRPGRFPSIPQEKKTAIVRKTTNETPPNATHWSRASMAEATGVVDQAMPIKG